MNIQDEAIAGKVRYAILQDKRISGQAIAVRVTEGEVFLKGIVDSEEQRDLALMVTQGIPGIRQVNIDELRVREAQQ